MKDCVLFKRNGGYEAEKPQTSITLQCKFMAKSNNNKHFWYW